jgi:hypothetical protein
LGVQERDGDNNSFSLGTGQRTQSLNGKKKKKKDNITMHLMEVGWEGVDWIHLVQDRD